LNGDGKLDLVAQMYFVGAGNAEAPATIATVLNNGDGTFATTLPVSYTAHQNGGSIELLSVQAADSNGDAKVDLALIYPPPLQTSLTYLSQSSSCQAMAMARLGLRSTQPSPPRSNRVSRAHNRQRAPPLLPIQIWMAHSIWCLAVER